MDRPSLNKRMKRATFEMKTDIRDMQKQPEEIEMDKKKLAIEIKMAKRDLDNEEKKYN